MKAFIEAVLDFIFKHYKITGTQATDLILLIMACVVALFFISGLYDSILNYFGYINRKKFISEEGIDKKVLIFISIVCVITVGYKVTDNIIFWFKKGLEEQKIIISVVFLFIVFIHVLLFKWKSKQIISKSKEDSIVFVNKPIKLDIEDVIGFGVQVNAIKSAIEKGANLIGIIADFGAGKSSVIELLMEQRTFCRPIIINLWDTLETVEKGDNNSNISLLTKSFLYQLATGIVDTNGSSSNFAKSINKRMSKNYGIISITSSSNDSIKFFAISIMAYIFSLSLKNSKDETVLMLFVPMILSFAILIGLYGLSKSVIAFSSWNSQSKREPEVSDVFDVFSDICQELFRRCGVKRQIVIVEDLDRVSDIDIVTTFLKEIYRFNNLMPEVYKNKISFIISVKPESELLGELSGGKTQKIYSKIFDFSINLNPIHNEDYEGVLRKLVSQKKSEFISEYGINIDKNEAVSELSWIIRGENLTVRDIKERLNNALLSYSSLKKRELKGIPAIEISRCAAVAYLEHSYPKDYYKLIKNEEAFAQIVSKAYAIINNDSWIDEQESELTEYIAKSVIMGTEPHFNVDLVNMLINRVIDVDFRMYFYTYPKGSYMKNTDEKDIFNLIVYPEYYQNVEDLNQKVSRIIAKEGSMVIEEGLRQRTNEALLIPKVILQDENLLLISLRNHIDQTLKLIISELKWNSDNIENSKVLLRKINLYEGINKSYLYLKYIPLLLKQLLGNDSTQILAIRLGIMEALGENIKYFTDLYISNANNQFAEIPVISEVEMNLVESDDIFFELLDINKIDEQSLDYIANRVNSRRISDKNLLKANLIYSRICDEMKEEVFCDHLLKYLTINLLADDSYFKIITKNYLIKKKDFSPICDYLTQMDVQKLTDTYYEAIDELGIEYGLPEIILSKLSEKSLYYSYFLSLNASNRLAEVDFNKYTFDNKIIEIFGKIGEKKPEAILNIRKSIMSKNAELINNFKYLYFGEYITITKEELNSFPKFADAITFVNGERIELDCCDYIWEYANQDTRDVIDVVKLFELFNSDNKNRIVNSSAMHHIIYSFDYAKICFKELTEEQKDNIILSMYNDMEFNLWENCLKFMLKSNCLVPVLENVIQINGNVIDYLGLVNELDTVTYQTINWISNQSIEVALCEAVTDKMIELKNYKNYIIGKTLRENELNMDLELVPFEEYYNVFVNTEVICELMGNNIEFLQMIVDQERYAELSASRLMKFYAINQKWNLLDTIFLRLNNEEILEYLIRIKGFATKEDSRLFKKYICTDENYSKVSERRVRDHIESILTVPNQRNEFKTFMKQRYPNSQHMEFLD